MLIELILICIGILVWKKLEILLVRSYNYYIVKETDSKVYTTIIMDKGDTIMGVYLVVLLTR